MKKTRQDRIRNGEIRNQLKLDSATDKLEITLLEWYGHIVRVEQGRVPWRITRSENN